MNRSIYLIAGLAGLMAMSGPRLASAQDGFTIVKPPQGFGGPPDNAQPEQNREQRTSAIPTLKTDNQHGRELLKKDHAAMHDARAKVLTNAQQLAEDHQKVIADREAIQTARHNGDTDALAADRAKLQQDRDAQRAQHEKTAAARNELRENRQQTVNDHAAQRAVIRGDHSAIQSARLQASALPQQAQQKHGAGPRGPHR